MGQTCQSDMGYKNRLIISQIESVAKTVLLRENRIEQEISTDNKLSNFV